MTDWTREKVEHLLNTNDHAVGRALVRLLERQTFDEKLDEDTKHRNGRGFKPCHARIGQSMAEFYQRNGYLSVKQAAYWRKIERHGSSRIGQYARQLIECIGETK